MYLNKSEYQLALDHMTIALNMVEELYGKDSNHATITAEHYSNIVDIVSSTQGECDTWQLIKFCRKSLNIKKISSNEKRLFYMNIGTTYCRLENIEKL